MWKSAKHRAASKGVPFAITIEDVEAIWTDRCPVLGIELLVGTGRQGAASPSLDRIRPELGYIPGNIQVLSLKANAMKSNATPEQLLKFAEWVNATFNTKQ